MSLAGTGSVHSVLMCIVMVEKIYHRMKLFFFFYHYVEVDITERIKSSVHS